jgi:predicted porin
LPPFVKQGQQTANADGARCGQFFNGPAYAGAGHPAYGQLLLGRQDSLMNDALWVYDPQARAPAFSFFGYAGSVNGAGSTELARWDNAVKYLFQSGTFHLSVMWI